MFSVQLKNFFALSSRIISPSFHLSEQQQHMGYPICTQSRKRMANTWHTEARFKVTLITSPLENVTAPACKITCIAFNSVAVQSAFNGIETPAATVSLTTGNIQNNSYHFPFPQPSLNTSEESGVWTLRAFTLQIKLLQLLNRFPRPFTDLPGKGHIELNKQLLYTIVALSTFFLTLKEEFMFMIATINTSSLKKTSIIWSLVTKKKFKTLKMYRL